MHGIHFARRDDTCYGDLCARCDRPKLRRLVCGLVLYNLHHIFSVSRYITEKEIDSQLGISLGGSPPLDILVRTSGVKRLSDFMLWQVRTFRALVSKFMLIYILQCSEDTQLQFSSAYWPDFGLFDFVPVILDYQRRMMTKRLYA